jgi:DNA polymerase zeta
MDALAIQTVIFDHYMLKSNHKVDFIEKSETPVPVIRIYGSTNQGHRILAHVHGFLPYLYFRPSNVNHTSFDNIAQVQSYLPALHHRLEDQFEKKRIAAIHAKREQQVDGIMAEVKPKRHIHHLETVSKLPFYGYWEQEKIFIKCFLYDPSDIKNLITIVEVRSL